ncbi:MAG: serine/threonine-protein kinase [Planctomycetota bacterium]|nr:serine/threonine-protein kinase [Planctomycetota bacterium]
MTDPEHNPPSPVPDPQFGASAAGALGADADDYPVIDGYDVIDHIGRGGMGVVYEALQQSTGRRVAVKLMLERAAATEAARRRFEREVELVARLQHPGIVSVLDSGLHRGRYFFVMEYIEGEPLDRALPAGEADLREIAGAVARIARAVDYAHQRGVMHRDLKPGNILVDTRGQPRLLDFGLAKAFDPNSMVQGRDSISQPGQVIGTLGYMPPEQARGDIQQVSVRSDVYSLGAIAYELMTGSLPCPIDGPMALVFQRIETRDPTRPSQLRKSIPADVDAILLRALEKDPQKRYPTAAALADDLERWLEDRPISARRAGVVQRCARWCRRNPALAAVAVLATTVVLVGLISAWAMMAAEARRARAEADKMAKDARFAEVLGKLNPDSAATDRAEATLIMLRELEQTIASEQLDPEGEAERRILLGEKYRENRAPAEAEAQFTRALDIYRARRPQPDAQTAWCLRNIAATYYDRGNYQKAEDLYRQSLQMRREVYKDRDHADVADGMNHLAATLMLMRRFDEARDLMQGALDMRRRLFPEDHKDVVATVNNLGALYQETGRYADAERHFSEALDRIIQVQGRETRLAARGMKNLARIRMAQENTEGVERLLNEAEGILARTLGPDNPEVAQTMVERGRLLRLEGRLAEAESECRRGLELLLRKLPATSPEIIAGRIIFARTLAAQGKGEEALREADAACAGIEQGNRKPDRLAEAQAARAIALVAMDRREEAEPILRDALAALEMHRGSGDYRTKRCARDLADLLSARGDHEGAREVLTRMDVAR